MNELSYKSWLIAILQDKTAFEL